jgi:hypothetical protein
MKTHQFTLALTCALIISLVFPVSARAARGTPESLEFAHGVYVDVNGQQVEAALHLAAEMNLDWVALDFDWAATWPDISKWNDTSRFASAMALARTLNLNVLVSIKNAPAWASTPQGPDAGFSAALVSELTQRYSNLLAVELYPQANTRAGWGATPDPAAYANLLKVVQSRLDSENRKVYLIAGGLSNTLLAADDMADVSFLQGLYATGTRPAIISIQFSTLSGSPLDEPAASNLRHYEQIRSVMTANSHTDGLLWMTRFCFPENIDAVQAQNEWLLHASEQMKSQLYIGAVFYGHFNSPAIETNPAASLVRPDLSLHPFIQTLSGLMGQQVIVVILTPGIRIKQMEISPDFAQILER